MQPDPKRSNWPATLIGWTEPPMIHVDGRWHGPHGAFLDMEGIGPSSWILCCPGCGQTGAPSKTAKWTIEEGSFADVSKLTLHPSIRTGCGKCDWHGYLIGGRYWSCEDTEGLKKAREALAGRLRTRNG